MKFVLIIVYVVVYLSTSCNGLRLKRQAKSCTGLENARGTCTVLSDCEVLRERVEKQRRNAALIRQIQSASLECKVHQSEVCCPNTGSSDHLPVPPQQLPTIDDGCGQLGKHVVFQKIIGGRPPMIGTWPWIALLAYDTSRGREFQCGGTVITRRHVLTAAHCINSNLVSVRLGEHDLNNQTETPHVDINIKKAVKHPSFHMAKSAGRNDIAVLYLTEEIQYGDFVRPVCLPVSELRDDSLVGYQPFVAGWGTAHADKEELSPVLQNLQITVYENKICDSVYKQHQRISEEDNIDDAFVCAGELAGGKDVCGGDSGGPLVVAQLVPGKGYRIILIGVVSAGIKCALKDAPSLFTKTSYYIDWIQEQCSKEV